MLQLSVIVPIFNAGQYLDKCIKSILSQSIEKMQVILVDDGSFDNSFEICQKYANADSRIEIIRKENKGLVSARKTGVQRARGRYTISVDADDWVEPGYFEFMVSLIKKSDADIVAAGHFHDIGTDSIRITNGVSPGIYNIEDILDKMIYAGGFFRYGIQPHIWNKLFKTDILRQVQLKTDEDINIGEDAAVVYPYILSSKKIAISDYCGYHYSQNGDSMSKNKAADERWRIERLITFLRNSFLELGIQEKLKSQMSVYEKYLFVMRDIGVFDKSEGQILRPFGGIKKGSKVALYGAGVLGRQIYRYIKEDGSVRIIKWVDKNWQEYDRQNMDVKSPASLKEYGEFDYVIIANLDCLKALEIKNSCLKMDIPSDKILWFSGEFVSGAI